jgi:hypothetical protein
MRGVDFVIFDIETVADRALATEDELVDANTGEPRFPAPPLHKVVAIAVTVTLITHNMREFDRIAGLRTEYWETSEWRLVPIARPRHYALLQEGINPVRGVGMTRSSITGFPDRDRFKARAG